MSEHKTSSKIPAMVILLLMSFSTVMCTTPGSSSLHTPAPSLDTCQANEDCILVIRVDVCCSCPEVSTQSRVRATSGIKTYVPAKEYGAFRPVWCNWAACSPCPVPTAGAICKSNKCQAPQTVQEILTACPDCFAQAAIAAYQSDDLQQAADFCKQIALNQQHTCFSELFDIALASGHLDEAEQLCRQHLNQDVGDCLRPIALKWAGTKEQYAITLCNELDPSDARYFGCILDIALAVRSQNRNRALEICAQLPANEAESCRREVLK